MQMNIRCITNRHLAAQEYFAQIKEIAKAAPEAVIVREKDLPQEEYSKLARQVMQICSQYDVACILHSHTQAAAGIGAKAIHLPLPKLLALSEAEKKQFSILGASVHSVQEAKQAQAAGATYITAGHIFLTDCKKGVPPRGLPFLNEVCKAVDLPVYALGGIHAGNAKSCIHAGAAGVCVMSECMQHKNVQHRLAQYVSDSL